MDTHQSSPSQENLKHPELKDAGEGSMLWDEYKYRHDLIWRHLIRSTLALVALVTVRYSTAFKPTVWLVTVAWVMALGYWVVTLFAVEPELRLFKQIKNLHRERQTLYFGLHGKTKQAWVVWVATHFGLHGKTKQTNDMKWGKVFLVDAFSCRVGTYLLLLLVATLLVGLVALLDKGPTLGFIFELVVRLR
jgi:hypothetical protein